MIKEKNLIDRYGHKSWACITGCSSGQGKLFAIKLAKRGFNILLIGSPRIENVAQDLNRYHPKIKTKCIVKDFADGFKDGFFDEIEKTFKEINLSERDFSGTKMFGAQLIECELSNINFTDAKLEKCGFIKTRTLKKAI